MRGAWQQAGRGVGPLGVVAWRQLRGHVRVRLHWWRRRRRGWYWLPVAAAGDDSAAPESRAQPNQEPIII